MGIRNKALLATAIILSTSFGFAAENDGKDKPVIQNNDPRANVPIKDMRGHDIKFVKRIASGVSKGAIVLAYMGDNPDEEAEVIEAARELIAKGVYIRGVILASKDPSENGKNTWNVFENGINVVDNEESDYTRFNTEKALKKTIIGVVEESWDRELSRQTGAKASLNPPE